MTARPALLAAALLALATGTALAQKALPEAGSLPFARPDAPGAAGAAIDDALRTGTVPARAAPGMAKDLLATGSVNRLASGLDALAGGDVAAARQMRDNLPAGSLDRKIMTWAIATGGNAGVRSGEIARAARTLTGWPGMSTLRANSERAMLRENPEPRIVIDAFGTSRPETVEGAILLARAQLAIGEEAAARRTLARYWRTERLDAATEAAILTEFGASIPASDHRFRMERMLYADRFEAAQRVAKLAGAEELASAVAAVSRNQKDAGDLLAAVPAEQRSALYIYAEARHLRRSGKYREAAEVMLEAPRDAASLVDPDAWWVERRVLSRELLDLDDPQTAYRLAAAHAAESPALAVDAEFHAGWYALRGMKDPAAAAPHFARIAEIAEGPISLSRAYYWLGRAAEAGAPGADAKSYYEKAAAYGTAFYGQLAAEKLGLATIPASFPAASDGDRASFEKREAVRAIRRLQEAGHPRRADALYRALAQEIESPGELALLSSMAERQQDHFLALRVGKWAAARGLDVGALAHPVGAIPSDADISGAGKALAYAIARQESEFNVAAQSRVGALGLLQLMPGTARDMARKAGLSYVPAKLTTDAGYNATLGARYLDEQLARFDGSYILTFAGYNAGPSRAREWMERYGDPRGKALDEVVDWIERIPFTETRSYVQRVMENYQVYKMQLTGSMQIAQDLIHGR